MELLVHMVVLFLIFLKNYHTVFHSGCTRKTFIDELCVSAAVQRIFSLDLIYLLKQIDINHSSWYAAVELSRAFFFITMSKENHTQYSRDKMVKMYFLSLVHSANCRVQSRDLDTQKSPCGLLQDLDED